MKREVTPLGFLWTDTEIFYVLLIFMDEHNKFNEASRLHSYNYVQLHTAVWSARKNNISTRCAISRERHIFLKAALTTAQDVSTFVNV